MTRTEEVVDIANYTGGYDLIGGARGNGDSYRRCAVDKLPQGDPQVHDNLLLSFGSN